MNVTTESADVDFITGYMPRYSGIEVGYSIQDAIGSLFDSIAQNAGLIILMIIALFGIISFMIIIKIIAKR